MCSAKQWLNQTKRALANHREHEPSNDEDEFGSSAPMARTDVDGEDTTVTKTDRRTADMRRDSPWRSMAKQVSSTRTETKQRRRGTRPRAPRQRSGRRLKATTEETNAGSISRTKRQTVPSEIGDAEQRANMTGKRWNRGAVSPGVR
jgi:hypothetical protein